MKVIRWVAGESRAQGKKVIEHLPEPSTELVSNLPDYSILLSGFADYSQFEMDFNNINFKSTLMYQTRVFRFPIRNSGKVLLKFQFSILDEAGIILPESDDSFFSVIPSSGAISGGESSIITIKFSPLEGGDYNCQLICEIPNLQKDQEILRTKLSGSSLRPFCHFELEDSDYILADRRMGDRSDGSMLVLEPNTKVMEFRSCGIRAKNMKKFYIVNPTHLSYEYVWKSESTNPQDADIFKCLTPKGVISSNKKSEIIFEFNPETIDVKVNLSNSGISLVVLNSCPQNEDTVFASRKRYRAKCVSEPVGN
jgi:hydrocephalus-inducing protein